MSTTMLMFTVCDTKADAYLPPFLFRTYFEAQRAFSDSVNKEGTTLHDHPEDFTLYCIGCFNAITGEVKPLEHKSLGKGSDFERKDA